jgi:hypothetical protein
MDVGASATTAITYVKLGRFAIIGFIDVPNAKQWIGTKVPVRGGINALFEGDLLSWQRLNVAPDFPSNRGPLPSQSDRRADAACSMRVNSRLSDSCFNAQARTTKISPENRVIKKPEYQPRRDRRRQEPCAPSTDIRGDAGSKIRGFGRAPR